MVSASPDGWIDRLSSHINRLESPLGTLSPNKLTDSPATGKLISPLAKAKQVVNTLTEEHDPKLVTLAFRCLYLKAKNSNESTDTIKKHQRYIIQLASKQHSSLCRQELSTLCAVLAGLRHFKGLKWTELLKHDFSVDEQLNTVLVSYYFFVFQGILQDVSKNLHTLTQNLLPVKLSMLWDVALSFLSTSGFSRALDLIDGQFRKKYLKNKVKMLSGFYKVTSFLLSKKSQDILQLCSQAFELKLKETDVELQVDCLKEQFCTEKYSRKLAPFIADYETRLGTTYGSSLPDNTPLPSGVSSLKLVQTEEICEISSHEISSPSKSTQEKILYFTKCINNGMVNLNFAAEVVTSIKSCCNNKTACEEIIRAVIPKILPLLKDLCSVDSTRQLSRVCFEFGNSKSSIVGLQSAATLDLMTLSFMQCTRDTFRITKRIEYSIWTILLLQELRIAGDIITNYLEFPNQVRIDDSFARMAYEAMLQGFRLTCFFGPSLPIDYDQQLSLIKALHPFLAKNSSLCDKTIQKIFDITKEGLRLSDIYEIVVLYGCYPDDSSFPSGLDIDSLYKAGIKTEGLHHKKIPLSAINEIELLINYWIETPSIRTDQSVGVFLKITEQLYYMGFYLLAESVLTASLTHGRPSNARTAFAFDLLRCKCKLALKDLNAIPPILTTAGSSLKEMGADAVSSTDVMKWKLLQLEYFFKAKDEERLARKLEEVGKFIKSRAEFDLNSESSTTSFEDRLNCVLLLAHYLLLIAQFCFSNCNFTQAIGYGKFSLKLIKSVLRASDSLPAPLLNMSNDLLYQCLASQYFCHRRIGAAKEALVFLNDLQKINLKSSSALMAYGHFDLVAHFTYVGKDKAASEEFTEGKRITKGSGIALLDTCMTIAATARENPKERDSNVVSSVLEMLEGFETRSIDPCMALSLCLIENLYISLGFCAPSSALFEAPEMNKLAQRNRQFMGMKALSTLRSEISVIASYLKPVMFTDKKFSLTRSLKVSPQFHDRIKGKLLECRDCLKKMTTGLFFLAFENCQQRELAHLSRVCRMMLFQIDDQGFNLETETNLLVSLEDAPKSLPYVNQRLIHSAPVVQPLLYVPLVSTTVKEEFPPDFQQVLPENWRVVVLDVCSITGDLMATRILSLEAPMSLNIPLKRLSNGASFDDLAKALAEIIEASNTSTKAEITSKVKTKEDRKNWWRNRFDLDLRLQELLQDIDSKILGGLNGILGPCVLSDAEFKLFSNALISIWKQTFPQLNGNWCLDPKICQLYYNLNPFDEERGFCEKFLLDLTQFCVESFGLDCKQTEIQQAVIQMRKLYKEPRSKAEGHLVLIPSDKCSRIPWESMNCIRGTSVTRMPSLRCLYDLLTQYSGGMKVRKEKEHRISYVVNPGKDLVRTQSIFEPIFTKLKGATGVCGQNPTEEKLVSLILSSDVYVYMGHGGGEQYVRLSSVTSASTESLPPALLMGCSSCAFESNGRLPTSSNIYNWLVRGSPTVVANLWDVTDRDIDLFTMSMLEDWNLISEEGEPRSLASAVSTSREKCILKYLNGSAPIVYGLPLWYR